MLLVGLIVTLLGMPGNWLMVVATAAYVALAPANSSAAIGWKVVVALLILAILGEIAEFLAEPPGRC